MNDEVERLALKLQARGPDEYPYGYYLHLAQHKLDQKTKKGKDRKFEEDWGDVSFLLLGRRDGSYDEVMDAIRYRLGRENYIRELEEELQEMR